MCQYCKIHELKQFGKYRHELNGYSVVTKGEGSTTEKANKRGDDIHDSRRKKKERRKMRKTELVHEKKSRRRKPRDNK